MHIRTTPARRVTPVLIALYSFSVISLLVTLLTAAIALGTVAALLIGWVV